MRWLFGPAAKLAPPLRPLFLWPVLGLPVYVAIQLGPVPVSWMRVLSPARAALALGPGWIPVSVSPPLTLAHLLRVLAYVLVFFSVRELGWRFARRRWLAAVPVLCVAALEAGLGLAQYFGGTGSATGTYVNPNHLAGLLEMSLPFAIMLAVANVNPVATALALVCSALSFLGILYSLSRMGLLAAVVSIGVLILLGLGRGRRFAAVAALTALGALVFFAVPERLLHRLDETEARLQFWKETSNLIADYPVAGTGLGTYVSAIQKYRTSAPLSLLDYAHNDYLQLLAELGLVGFLPLLGYGLAFMVWLYRFSAGTASLKYRLLGMACAASLSALMLHSIVDFNLYIPANAMLAAWVAGLASSLDLIPEGHSFKPQGLNLR